MEYGKEMTEKQINQKQKYETILRDGKNCYLRILLEEGGEQSYEIQMINRTQPPHFMRMSIMEQAHNVFLDYNVTGLVSLEQVDKRELLTYLYAIITSLCRVGEECSEYLIPADKVDLLPSHIFFRMETGQVYYAFSPEKKETMRETLQSLLEYFMKNANLIREEDVLNVYGMYQRTLESNVTFQSLYDYLQEACTKEPEGTVRYRGLENSPGERDQRNPSDERNAQIRTNEKETKITAKEKALYDSLGIEVSEETAFDLWLDKQNDIPKEDSWRGDAFEVPEARPVYWHAEQEETPIPSKTGTEKTGVVAKLKKFLAGKSLEIGVGVFVLALSTWLLLT